MQKGPALLAFWRAAGKKQEKQEFPRRISRNFWSASGKKQEKQGFPRKLRGNHWSASGKKQEKQGFPRRISRNLWRAAGKKQEKQEFPRRISRNLWRAAGKKQENQELPRRIHVNFWRAAGEKQEKQEFPCKIFGDHCQTAGKSKKSNDFPVSFTEIIIAPRGKSKKSNDFPVSFAEIIGAPRGTNKKSKNFPVVSQESSLLGVGKSKKAPPACAFPSIPISQRRSQKQESPSCLRLSINSNLTKAQSKARKRLLPTPFHQSQSHKGAVKSKKAPLAYVFPSSSISPRRSQKQESASCLRLSIKLNLSKAQSKARKCLLPTPFHQAQSLKGVVKSKKAPPAYAFQSNSISPGCSQKQESASRLRISQSGKRILKIFSTFKFPFR